MKPELARSAKPLVTKIDEVEALLAKIDVALAEQWPVRVLRVVAPAEGASQPEGTEVDLLGGVALPIADLWKIALTTARGAHQSVLDELNAQLEAL